MVRSFLAIDLNRETKNFLDHAMGHWQRLPCKIRWTRVENLHITLKFLGEISQDTIEQLIPVLSSRLSGLSPFTLTLSGVGAFPSLRNARILWIGFQESKPLLNLVKIVEDLCAEQGIPREARGFHPHITVGRIKAGRSVYQKILPFFTTPVPAISMGVSKVVLYRSDLFATGPVYSQLAHFPLEGNL